MLELNVIASVLKQVDHDVKNNDELQESQDSLSNVDK